MAPIPGVRIVSKDGVSSVECVGCNRRFANVSKVTITVDPVFVKADLQFVNPGLDITVPKVWLDDKK